MWTAINFATYGRHCRTLLLPLRVHYLLSPFQWRMLQLITSRFQNEVCATIANPKSLFTVCSTQFSSSCPVSFARSTFLHVLLLSAWPSSRFSLPSFLSPHHPLFLVFKSTTHLSRTVSHITATAGSKWKTGEKKCLVSGNAETIMNFENSF